MLFLAEQELLEETGLSRSPGGFCRACRSHPVPEGPDSH